MSRQTYNVNNTTLHCNWRPSNIIIVSHNMWHLWWSTLLNLSTAKSAAWSAVGRRRDSEVGKFASLGDIAGQGGSLADKTPLRLRPFHLRKLAAFLLVQKGDTPFPSPPFHPAVAGFWELDTWRMRENRRLIQQFCK